MGTGIKAGKESKQGNKQQEEQKLGNEPTKDNTCEQYIKGVANEVQVN